MNKKQTALCNELCALLGHKSWTKAGRRCTGKWSGTTDYSLIWEDGTGMFISNGMSYFDTGVSETIDMLKRTRNPENQRAMMEVLWEFEDDDAKMAKEAGLQRYELLGLLEIVEPDIHGMIWWGVRIKVGDRIINYRETGMSYDIKNGADKLRETRERNKGKELWTAGGVETPSYVIHGVAHDMNYACYQARGDERITFYSWERPLEYQLREALLKQVK
ncbi:MAG: hypothetical protein J5732_02725 [Bacteroidaceae bacterium]|nr:hypothetical protein [Bacteroidaceae bacterium]